MAITVIPASDVRPRAGTQSPNSCALRPPWVPDISLTAKFRDDRGLVSPSMRGSFLALAALATLLLLPTFDASAQSRRERPPEEAPEQYPAGTHRDDTFYFCTACHGFKIVAQQGQTRERWSETIDIMASRHGMVDVQGEQREQMLDYLSKAFPERRAPGGWKNPFER
jgi:hypothetical protein